VRVLLGKKGENWQKRQNGVSLKGSKPYPKKENIESMTLPSVHIQISSEEVPSVSCWFGEVAIVAHCFTTSRLLTTIAQQVRLARARFGTYEVLDFVVVLLGYAISKVEEEYSVILSLFFWKRYLDKRDFVKNVY
jgi:hydrogenase maturation factor